jgi:hypothetical protein
VGRRSAANQNTHSIIVKATGAGFDQEAMTLGHRLSAGDGWPSSDGRAPEPCQNAPSVDQLAVHRCFSTKVLGNLLAPGLGFDGGSAH